MLDQVESMFTDYVYMIGMKSKTTDQLFKKADKKETYEKNMMTFRENYGHFFNEMMELMDAADVKNAEAQIISEKIVKTVTEIYIATDYFRRGRRITDLNLFLIYYVFPAIQLTQNTYAPLLCDTLRDTWNRHLGTKISYTDYNDLLANFNDKIFGVL